MLKLHTDQLQLSHWTPNMQCSKVTSQKFDDSLDLNDALNKCVVDLNLVQWASF